MHCFAASLLTDFPVSTGERGERGEGEKGERGEGARGERGEGERGEKGDQYSHARTHAHTHTHTHTHTTSVAPLHHHQCSEKGRGG